MEMTDIQSMKLEELEQLMEELEQKKFRAKQIFEWIHKKQANDYDQMKNLPSALRDLLKDRYPLVSLSTVTVLKDSEDKTEKFLFKLPDGNLVETVLMRYEHGASICVSSQVGCRMGCTFCASTINGLKRQLKASEILEQIYSIERFIGEPIQRIVMMGTGEPFDNYKEISRFLNIVTDAQGRNLSKRNITVSTCGIIEKIEQFTVDFPQVNLAISLHSPFQEERQKMMPIARANHLPELILACKSHVKKTGRRITFEYSLIDRVNDSTKHADALAKWLTGFQCHVNLIPVNPVREKDQKASDGKRIKNFEEQLLQRNITTTIRRSLGQNIDAACGQLRNQYIEKE